ncbi:unnamed protein product [Commensalibacter communis]|uniref:Eco47II family restriction endonuclease n=1 Tax=Commensalibacter communis TaxID=2972786 RepID=UPI0022FFAE87|nr:Eco47II family restriction endonuclease [Commensalibacter communis]CAI3949851.1 unnamed protein product [Commensalibacter communis]
MNQTPILPFMNDNDFLDIIKLTFDKALEAKVKAENNIHKNVIDPFLMIFEMSGFELNEEQWLKNEKTRQAQKTLSNHIGLFHQKCIGAINGWIDLGTKEIVDVVHHEKRIIAEIKNKYNTVKQSDLIGIYSTLENLVMPKTQKYKGYTSYYVEIIPRKPHRFNECFIPSNNKTGDHPPRNELIRRIDGASFYELVTNDKQALAKIYNVIPIAIQRLYPNLTKIDTTQVKRYFTRAYG